MIQKPKKKKSSWFCCFSSSKSLLSVESKFHISKNRLEKFLNENSDKPLDVLLKIYISHDLSQVYKTLSVCRINPNFVSKNFHTNNLEFYIP